MRRRAGRRRRRRSVVGGEMQSWRLKKMESGEKKIIKIKYILMIWGPLN